jgi:isopenicillin-N N-acyltransferase like protein
MFPVLELTGNPFVRGKTLGQLARAQVTGSVRCYAALFASCGIAWVEAQRRAAEFHDIVEGCGGGMMEEMEGIALGSGFHINEILALNCRTEILPPTFLDVAASTSDAARRKNTALGLFDLGECTSVAIAGRRSADGFTRVAQNWDWIGYQRQNVLALRVHRDDPWPSFLTLTEAGILAKIGVNEHGLAVGLNILRATNDREHVGIPVHIFQRMALDCASVDAVVALAESLIFAASSNAILGDATGRVCSLEYSPNGAAAIPPDQGVVAHTNHFADAELFKHQAPLAQMLTTEPRLARANHHISRWPDYIDDDHLQALLRDESGDSATATDTTHAKFGAICRSPDPSLPPELQVESVFGVIINCNAREMWVAPDVPSKVEFEHIAL